MNDLDLCLKVVSRSCQPFCHICRWISNSSPREKLLRSSWHLFFLKLWPHSAVLY